MMHRLVLFALCAYLVACSQPKSEQKDTPRTAQADTAAAKPFQTWKELDEFHTVMAETYHPMEDGNFAPIRARASELAMRAKEWANSQPPANFVLKPEFKATMDSLVQESARLAEMIAKNAPDTDVKTALTALHERFHQVEGMCQRK